VPKGWNVLPILPHVQAVGDAWARSRRSLALRVPSAIVAGGFNILINPDHPDFRRLTVDSIAPNEFDPMLVR
jgi:RES domain-containing protein